MKPCDFNGGQCALQTCADIGTCVAKGMEQKLNESLARCNHLAFSNEELWTEREMKNAALIDRAMEKSK